MVNPVEIKVCLLCEVFDDTGELEYIERCPKCEGLLVRRKGYICPGCNRLSGSKLIKCVGCSQLGVEFIGCEDCMNHKGPVRHHIECPVWKRRAEEPSS